MKIFCLVAMTLASVLALGSPAVGAAVGAERWEWPTAGEHRVHRGFDPPLTSYSAGHRGVDLLGTTGAVVSSVAAGQVTFAGSVAGTPVVTIEHDGESSTYQPVAAVVSRGDDVAAGQMLGRLLRMGSHCAPRTCLHLGRKAGSRYLDPLALLTAVSRVRLISPRGDPPDGVAGALSGDRGGDLGGALLRPVSGPVSSQFGMRRHPVTGIVKLHDGIDFAAPCGTGVRVSAPGAVVRASFHSAYGNRVVVDHGARGGRRLVTSYNHLSGDVIRVGQRLNAGQLIGRVGSTGLSTGCHLHFMVEAGGRPINPSTLLPR